MKTRLITLILAALALVRLNAADLQEATQPLLNGVPQALQNAFCGGFSCWH